MHVCRETLTQFYSTDSNTDRSMEVFQCSLLLPLLIWLWLCPTSLFRIYVCTVYSVTAVTDVHSEPDIRKGRRIDSPLIVSIFVLYREHVLFTTWN